MTELISIFTFEEECGQSRNKELLTRTVGGKLIME